MRHDFIILAAGIGDLLSALVPVVVFIIWVIGQIANRQAAAPPKPVRRADQKPAGDWNMDDEDDDVVVAQPANAGPKKTVFDEIEQFLARARQQAQQAQQGQQPGTPQYRPPIAKPVVAEPVMAELAAPRGLVSDGTVGGSNLGTRDRVGASISRTTDTSDITANVDRLGDSVEVADDVMEAHLKEVFDHRLGSLQQVATAAPAAQPATKKAGKAAPAPVGFAALFANSGNVRQAIVLNEILQRPSDRW
jgi:hypothetical protein